MAKNRPASHHVSSDPEGAEVWLHCSAPRVDILCGVALDWGWPRLCGVVRGRYVVMSNLRVRRVCELDGSDGPTTELLRRLGVTRAGKQSGAEPSPRKINS
ncbi:hypothetical protein NDU88_008061 [Pleurodeles waltl]|uniref:Uncharacterized protein n=1 Tax=Pleurodeles waltl TaxID=8319 RepID=A0AAV7NC04_PLEWA|nr:hypothetical protein NDU88_008061 [Pleurodeles waltl]